MFTSSGGKVFWAISLFFDVGDHSLIIGGFASGAVALDRADDDFIGPRRGTSGASELSVEA